MGQYSPQGDSPYDLADMAGNVWEWCLDFYEESHYQASRRKNPAGPARGELRVLRGGSWDVPALEARSAYRGGDYPGSRVAYVGFRVVASPFKA